MTTSMPLEQQVPLPETCIKLQPYLKDFETVFVYYRNKSGRNYGLTIREGLGIFYGDEVTKAPTVAELGELLVRKEECMPDYDTENNKWFYSIGDESFYAETEAEARAQLYLEIMKERENE